MPASYLKLLREETPRYDGAASTAPYRLSTLPIYLPIKGFKPKIGPQYLDRSDELRGTEGDTPDLRVGFDAGGSLSMNCYLNALTWLLHVAGFAGVHTTGDGVITDPDAQTIPAGAHRWVFNKRVGAQAAAVQADAAFGDANDGAGILLRGQGFGVSRLGLTAPGELSADLLGLIWKRVVGPTFDTPSYDVAAIPPLLQRDLTLTWLASGAKFDDFSLNVENPLVKSPDLSLSPSIDSPALLEHDNQRVRITGSINKRKMADADIDALTSGATFSATARWKSQRSIGGTAYKYSIWFQMPACFYTDDDIDDLGNKRRHPASFPFKAGQDDTAGYDCRITVVNAVAATSTPFSE